LFAPDYRELTVDKMPQHSRTGGVDIVGSYLGTITTIGYSKIEAVFVR
jgi:hypothetical protein